MQRRLCTSTALKCREGRRDPQTAAAAAVHAAGSHPGSARHTLAAAAHKIAHITTSCSGHTAAGPCPNGHVSSNARSNPTAAAAASPAPALRPPTLLPPAGGPRRPRAGQPTNGRRTTCLPWAGCAPTSGAPGWFGTWWRACPPPLWSSPRACRTPTWQVRPAPRYCTSHGTATVEGAPASWRLLRRWPGCHDGAPPRPHAEPCCTAPRVLRRPAVCLWPLRRLCALHRVCVVRFFAPAGALGGVVAWVPARARWGVVAPAAPRAPPQADTTAPWALRPAASPACAAPQVPWALLTHSPTHSLLPFNQQVVGPVAVTSIILGSGLENIFGSNDDPNNPADPDLQMRVNHGAVQARGRRGRGGWGGRPPTGLAAEAPTPDCGFVCGALHSPITPVALRLRAPPVPPGRGAWSVINVSLPPPPTPPNHRSPSLRAACTQPSACSAWAGSPTSCRLPPSAAS